MIWCSNPSFIQQTMIESSKVVYIRILKVLGRVFSTWKFRDCPLHNNEEFVSWWKSDMFWDPSLPGILSFKALGSCLNVVGTSHKWQVNGKRTYLVSSGECTVCIKSKRLFIPLDSCLCIIKRIRVCRSTSRCDMFSFD